MIMKTKLKKSVCRAGKVTSIAISGSLLMSIIGAANACTDNERERDGLNDTVRAVNKVVNNSSVPVSVRIGRHVTGGGKSETEPAVVNPGNTFDHTHKVGGSAKVKFEFILGEAQSSENELVRCDYIIRNSGSKASTFWNDWSCLSSSENLTWTCDRTWKSGQEHWVTTLELLNK